ncbi:unnamed protein product [Amoebophrya sp. A120]|nr:unnamed protein product [Amoebophrya sp. A120]|eukprot:GSA120T00020271001.1
MRRNRPGSLSSGSSRPRTQLAEMHYNVRGMSLSRSFAVQDVDLVYSCSTSSTVGHATAGKTARRNNATRNTRRPAPGIRRTFAATAVGFSATSEPSFFVHANKSSWCHGEQREAKKCEEKTCPGKDDCRDCEWGKWGPWEPKVCPCNGLQERHREISTHNNFCGKACEGVKTETRSCGVPTCVPDPVDCVFTKWSAWSECDALCDGGTEKRTREILSPAKNGGKVCAGHLEEQRPCNAFPCHPKIDCKLTDWSSWSECTNTCGGGQKERVRHVDVPPMYGGKPCDGDLIEVTGCNTDSCDKGVDCVWDEWEKWSSCSATCGGGEHMRERLIKVAPRYGGKLCSPHDMTQIEACNQQPCHKPVDCIMGEWGKWASCSATCNGVRERDRVVKQYPDHNGKPCAGELREVKPCNLEDCHKDDFVPKEPIECKIGAWGNWTECSVTCGGGYKEKHRQVVQLPLHGGEGCEGALKLIEPCAQEECKPEHVLHPVDCKWSDWEAWSGCSRSCGGGEKTRQRQVLTMPNRIGTPCAAKDNMEVASCNEDPCDAVDCVWGQWSGWGACTCTGLEERHRVIQKHATQGGHPCDGAKIETRACHPDCEHPPQDCLLGDWESWGQCSASCGGGQTIRQRHILQKSNYGGKGCAGELKEISDCNVDKCPTDPEPVDCKLDEWSNWSACSAECNGGQKFRHREVLTQGRHGGKTCTDEMVLAETASCNTQTCDDKKDCQWGEWSKWGDCSRTCGSGQKERTREVLQSPRYGGEMCPPKVTSEVAPCNTQECPGALHCVDGVWSDWSDYSLCSASCGDGFQYRTREIAVAANSCGKPLVGLRQEFRECNRGACDHHVKDCKFSSWEDWGDCSCPCNGIKERTRRIDTYPDNGGKGCNGSLKQIAACNEKVCSQWQPVNCKVSTWGPWSGCSAKCGGGFKTRKKSILKHPKNGGKPCNDDLEEVTSCNEQECQDAVDCEMGSWDDWGSCSARCGGGGIGPSLQCRSRAAFRARRRRQARCEPATPRRAALSRTVPGATGGAGVIAARRAAPGSSGAGGTSRSYST